MLSLVPRVAASLVMVVAVLPGASAHAQAGSTTPVSVSSSGQQASSESREPALSASGRYVAFESDASNLVPNDTNAQPDVFVDGGAAAGRELASSTRSG